MSPRRRRLDTVAGALWFAMVAGCAASTTNASTAVCVSGLSGAAREAAIDTADARVKECERGDEGFPLAAPDRRWACRYAGVLRAMGEGTLWGSRVAESYRFLWLRSFHNPVMVRVDRTPAGTFVTAKQLDGSGSVPGCVNRSVRRQLSDEETDGLLARYRAVFATPLPASGSGNLTVGADGAQWVFEKTGESVRVVRDLWSPDEPRFAAYRALCLYMVRLARFHVPENEVY